MTRKSKYVLFQPNNVWRFVTRPRYASMIPRLFQPQMIDFNQIGAYVVAENHFSRHRDVAHLVDIECGDPTETVHRQSC